MRPAKPRIRQPRDTHCFIQHIWKDGEWGKGELVHEPYVSLASKWMAFLSFLCGLKFRLLAMGVLIYLAKTLSSCKPVGYTAHVEQDLTPHFAELAPDESHCRACGGSAEASVLGYGVYLIVSREGLSTFLEPSKTWPEAPPSCA